MPRENTRVHDPQPAHPAHPQPRIHRLPHRAPARRVVLADAEIPHRLLRRRGILQIDLGRRFDAAGQAGGDGGGAGDAVGELEGGGQDGGVGGVGVVGGVDGGGGGGVCFSGVSI